MLHVRREESDDMKTLKLWVKHTGSCLPDVGFEVEIDEQRKRVVVKTEAFDSALVAHLITVILPTDAGVVAFRDDSIGWVKPPAPYSLELQFGGQRFEASVVKLLPLGSASAPTATRLELIN
jgi:hypothetical protein